MEVNGDEKYHLECEHGEDTGGIGGALGGYSKV